MPTADDISEPLLVVCSDIHLTLKPPIARAVDGVDWLATQAGYLSQVDAICKRYGVPLAIAGDLFDRWNPSPELITFALRHLPSAYAIPGQHDLPYHAFADVSKSAFGVLAECGHLKLITPEKPIKLPGCSLYGLPWGLGPSAFASRNKNHINIGIVHAYIWSTRQNAYAGALPSTKAAKWANKLRGFDAVCFGDNHKGFTSKFNGTWIVNCGGFMRRKSDETRYRPRCVVLHVSQGRLKVAEQFLDVSGDQFVESDVVEAVDSFASAELIAALADITSGKRDILEAIKCAAALKDCGPNVVALLERALDGRLA